MALSADNSSLVSCARTREHGLPSDHGRAPVWRSDRCRRWPSPTSWPWSTGRSRSMEPSRSTGSQGRVAATATAAATTTDRLPGGTMTKPLVLLQPAPQRRDRIFTPAAYARLLDRFDVVDYEARPDDADFARRLT